MKGSYVLPFFFIILTTNCLSSGKENCKYGDPTAVFQQGQAGIQAHTFNIQGNEAQETVVFTDSLKLTLLQSGCNEIRQEFQFTFKGNFQDKAPSFWIAKSIELLRRLGSLGIDYAGFSTWAQTIEAQQEQIKLAESTALQQGFFVTIDRITGTDNATLVLILSDKP